MWPEPSHPAPGRIGYVLKMYPRFSETFVVSELLAREAHGTATAIYSLRAPVDPHFHDTLAQVRAGVTYLPRVRRAEDLWDTLRKAAPALPRLSAVLPELVRESAEDAAQAVALALRVRQDGLTHLHAHFASVATTVARLASLLTGVPYSFTAHAKDIFHQDVDDDDLRRKIADAHHVVTISAYNQRHLRALIGSDGGPGDPIHLVHNGLDLERFTPAGPPSRRPDDHRVPPGAPLTPAATTGSPGRVVAVGRLVEKKGFAVLVDACRELVDRGRSVRCTIVGGGALHAALADQIRVLGLTDVVELTGPLPQERVREQLAAADVLAVPCVVGQDGNADGLPTVVLEAMALGTPCVSTDVTGLVEVVEHERTGLQVPQHDAVGLADALGRLLDDPALRRTLAERARAMVEHRFDARRQSARLDALVGASTPETEH